MTVKEVYFDVMMEAEAEAEVCEILLPFQDAADDEAKVRKTSHAGLDACELCMGDSADAASHQYATGTVTATATLSPTALTWFTTAPSLLFA